MDWVEYWGIEPFGDEWRQTGLLATLLAAPYSKRKFSVEDFMPNKRRKTPQENALMLRQFFQARKAAKHVG